MGATGVISDHAADRAAVVRRWVGREHELMRTKMFLEGVEHYAWLYPGDLLLRIDVDDLIHVLRKVQNHGDIATLSSKTCARPSRQHRSVEFSAKRHGGHHVGIVAWHN